VLQHVKGGFNARRAEPPLGRKQRQASAPQTGRFVQKRVSFARRVFRPYGRLGLRRDWIDIERVSLLRGTTRASHHPITSLVVDIEMRMICAILAGASESEKRKPPTLAHFADGVSTRLVLLQRTDGSSWVIKQAYNSACKPSGSVTVRFRVKRTPCGISISDAGNHFPKLCSRRSPSFTPTWRQARPS